MLLTHVVCAGGLRLRYVGSAAILRVVASSLLSAKSSAVSTSTWRVGDPALPAYQGAQPSSLVCAESAHESEPRLIAQTRRASWAEWFAETGSGAWLAGGRVSEYAHGEEVRKAVGDRLRGSGRVAVQQPDRDRGVSAGLLRVVD
jgi:hypothetical protein